MEYRKHSIDNDSISVLCGKPNWLKVYSIEIFHSVTSSKNLKKTFFCVSSNDEILCTHISS